MTFVTTYQSGHLVLPSQLLFRYHQLFDNSDDFLVWQFCYLHNTTNLVELLPSQIAQAIGQTVVEVNRSLGRLTQKELLVIKTIEVAGDIETIFDTSPAFAQLDSLLAAEAQEALGQQVVSDNPLKALVTDFERELGRLLSPFELEDLQKLLTEVKTDPALIREALREAVFNGKTNWNYIQAILRNWRKEGIVNLRQIEERRREREGTSKQELELDDDFKKALNLWRD